MIPFEITYPAQHEPPAMYPETSFKPPLCVPSSRRLVRPDPPVSDPDVGAHPVVRAPRPKRAPAAVQHRAADDGRRRHARPHGAPWRPAAVPRPVARAVAVHGVRVPHRGAHAARQQHRAVGTRPHEVVS